MSVKVYGCKGEAGVYKGKKAIAACAIRPKKVLYSFRLEAV